MVRPMIVRVSEIPEEGLRLEGVTALERPFADPAWTLEDLSLLVERDGDVVFVSGRLAVRLPQTCGRCLEPFSLAIEPAVETRFVPDTGENEERELGTADLDTDLYAGDQLDIGALVQAEATLALPMKPLCREDCRGLCPVCGGNRNLVACACEDATPDPRWAPLKSLAERLSR